MNNEFIDEYDYENVQRKLMNSNRNEGYREGLEDGITQEKQEIANKMLSKNIDIKTISEVTGLTETEINELNSKD